MTTLFYAPPDHLQSGILTLPEDESHHAASVLRHKAGDVVEVVDGHGTWHRVRLTNVARRAVSGEVLDSRRNVGEPPYRLRLALAPLKNPSRFEVVVEKAVELGVSTIVPVLTERTERFRLKPDRLHRLTVAAMKQCGRSRLLRFENETTWAELLQASSEDLRLVCHEGAGEHDTIMDRLRAVGAKTILVAIGPEGGFSDAEIEAAVQSGFTSISLGPRRLRSETAAITAAAAVMIGGQGVGQGAGGREQGVGSRELGIVGGAGAAGTIEERGLPDV